MRRPENQTSKNALERLPCRQGFKSFHIWQGPTKVVFLLFNSHTHLKCVIHISTAVCLFAEVCSHISAEVMKNTHVRQFSSFKLLID